MNFLPGKGFKASTCKTQLRMATARIKLLRNKRDIQVKVLKKEIAQLLSSGQESSARIRVEHVMREQNIIEAYDAIEIFAELIAVRLPIIESQKTCPTDLKEAISSLVFATPRCADLPELAQVRTQFQAKYGKEFISAATELRPGCGVHRRVIEKLSVNRPAGEAKLKLMKEIAAEHNVEWDTAAFEKELTMTPNDLLEGPTRFTCAPEPTMTEEFPSVPNQKPNTSTQTTQAAPTSLPVNPVPYVHITRPPPKESKPEVQGQAPPIEKHDLGLRHTQPNEAPPSRPAPDRFPPQVNPNDGPPSKLAPEMFPPQATPPFKPAPQVTQLRDENPGEHPRRHSMGPAVDLGPARREGYDAKNSRRESDRFPQLSQARDEPWDANSAVRAAAATNEAKFAHPGDGGKQLTRPAPAHHTAGHESDEYVSLSDSDFTPAPYTSKKKANGMASLQEGNPGSEDSEEDVRLLPMKRDPTGDSGSGRRASMSKAGNGRKVDSQRPHGSDEDDDGSSHGRNLRKSSTRPASQDYRKSDSRQSRHSQEDDAEEPSPRRGDYGRNPEPRVGGHHRSDHRQSQRFDEDEVAEQAQELDAPRVEKKGSQRKEAGQTKSRASADDYVERNALRIEDTEEESSDRGSRTKGSTKARLRDKVYYKEKPVPSHDFEEEDIDGGSHWKGYGKSRSRDRVYYQSDARGSYDEETHDEGSHGKVYGKSRSKDTVHYKSDARGSYDEEALDEGSHGRVSGKAKSKDSVHHKSESRGAYYEETLGKEGSRGRASGWKSTTRTAAEEYHKSASGRSRGSDEDFDRAPQFDEEPRPRSATKTKPKSSQDEYRDIDRAAARHEEPRLKATTRVKSKASSHEEYHDSVRSLRNEHPESVSGRSSEDEHPAYTKDGGRGSGRAKMPPQEEEYKKLEYPSHGSEDDAIIPSAFIRTKAQMSHGSRYDHDRMPSPQEEGAWRGAAGRKAKPQADDSRSTDFRKPHASEEYPSSPVEDGGFRKASGRTKKTHLEDEQKEETTLLNAPVLDDLEDDVVAPLWEDQSRISKPSTFEEFYKNESKRYADHGFAKIRFGRGELEPPLKAPASPIFDDEVEDFDDKIFSHGSRATKPDRGYRKEERPSSRGAKDVSSDVGSTSGKRMSLPGDLLYEKPKYETSRGRDAPSSHDEFGGMPSRATGRRATVGGEELHMDVNRESERHVGRAKAAASQAFEDSRPGLLFEDREEPKGKKQPESKRLHKIVPKARETYLDNRMELRLSPRTAAERDKPLEQRQERPSSPLDHDEYNLSPSIGKLKGGKHYSPQDEESRTPGGRPLRFVSSSNIEPAAQPTPRAQSNLATVKASSDSWGQQKAPAQDPRRTLSAAEEDAAPKAATEKPVPLTLRPAENAPLPRISKEKETRTGPAPAKTKLPDWDDFVAKFPKKR